MSVDVEYAHIEKVEGKAVRLRQTPRRRGVRIVMDYLAYGWSVDEMCRQHPYLTPAEAHAAMADDFDHRKKLTVRSKPSEEAAAALANAPPTPFLAGIGCAKGLRA